MKLEHWEPDIDTLVSRIHRGDIDMQPDFQRGLVWNRGKQQRLIDTILRGWSIPPIHLVVDDDERMLVLDGQQRLAAITSFTDGDLTVGDPTPPDPNILPLSGLTFARLPASVQRRFLNFRISCYRLTDYQASEPYELFFRLNMPTGLTQAEKRNALVGPPRQQVRELVSLSGWSKERVGFANGRMSYDDIVARCCCYVEARSLSLPINVRSLEVRYRDETGFSEDVVETVESALRELSDSIASHPRAIRFNKATLLSWLMVYARQIIQPRFQSSHMRQMTPLIEDLRNTYRSHSGQIGKKAEGGRIADLIAIYTDRSSLRVTDVSSVVLRDLAIWAIATSLDGQSDPTYHPAPLDMVLAQASSYEDWLHLGRSEQINWGDLT